MLIKRIFHIALFISVLVLASCSSEGAKESQDSKVLINNEWRFSIVDDCASIVDNSYDDSSWDVVTLPHTAHLEPLLVNNQWQGICYYRKRINIENYSPDNKYFVEFEALMNSATIWINGKKVVTDQGGYLPTIFDLTPFAGEKEILMVLRLDNRDNPVTGPKPLSILDFCMYGGIYRNAYLITKKRLYITDASYVNKCAGGGIFITTPKVAKENSIVNIKGNIANDYSDNRDFILECNIYYKEKLVASSSSDEYHLSAGSVVDIELPITINNAALWSPAEPNLYSAEVIVRSNGEVSDCERVGFGIREFTFKGNDLYINGEKTFLRGVNRHQEYPFVGYALSDNAQRRDAKLIKEAGFDYVRLSHYPQSPAFMEACDELGIVVIDAILGWQYFDDSEEFTRNAYTSVRRLVRRDRNHPSILAWEVSLNETAMPKYFMDRLHKIVKEEYPHRGNYTAGWIYGSYDIFFQARQHRILHPDEINFDKPYLVSEYGDWEYYSTNAGLNQHNHSQELRLELSSRQHRRNGEKALLQQAYNVQESHNDNLSTPAFADSYWVMFDYNRGYHNDLETSGIMDIFRLPKFSYDFYRSQQDATPIMVSIATYWNEKSSNSVIVYNNCDSVALYHNDALVAVKQGDQNEISCNLKHAPSTFDMMSGGKRGALKAVGYINGEVVAEDIVLPPSTPTSLRCRVADCGIEVESNDMVFIYIEAIDDNGTVAPDFSEEINVSLPKGVKLMNQDAVVAEAGTAPILVKVGDISGVVTGSATSKSGLKGKIEMKIK